MHSENGSYVTVLTFDADTRLPELLIENMLAVFTAICSSHLSLLYLAYRNECLYPPLVIYLICSEMFYMLYIYFMFCSI